MKMKTKIGIAKLLRRRETESERVVWEIIRDRRFHGLKFRRQHIISGFITDFYCAELKLAIEIDGRIHENQKEYDALRQTIIEKENIRILRIDSRDAGISEAILKNWIATHSKSWPVDLDRIPPLHAFRHGEGVRG